MRRDRSQTQPQTRPKNVKVVTPLKVLEDMEKEEDYRQWLHRKVPPNKEVIKSPYK